MSVPTLGRYNPSMAPLLAHPDLLCLQSAIRADITAVVTFCLFMVAVSGNRCFQASGAADRQANLAYRQADAADRQIATAQR
jgi:hypothetical protein